jgi:DNA invertase Pin-like site-specific DNA recombinase
MTPYNVLNKNKILRAGLFERVSTEEQSKFGYSIATQIEALEEHAEKHRMKIVDHYCDAGVSAGISYKKRPEMMRLLQDVENGKIDIIIFTRLDRWFRNITEYFKVQEILEKHNVEWRAIWEDYDTTTANGRMAITIFLAIAQNEREKTSERIQVVFENKRKNKESFFGKSSTPFGYTEQRDENGIMRLVKDPELEPALQMFWDIAVKYENVNKAAKMVNLEYGIKKNKNKWMELSKKEIYTGDYRGVEGYCPAYVSKEDWLKLQNRKIIKQTKSDRVYLFTGLIECPECGHNLASTYCVHKQPDGSKREYHNYRCQFKEAYVCKYNHTFSELKIEKWLLKNIRNLMHDEIARVEIEKTKPRPKPKTNVSALKEQLRRLEVVYMTGNKPDEEYIKEQRELNNAIKKAESENPKTDADKDLTMLHEILSTDFESVYKTLSAEDRRRFWRGIIRRIYLDGNKISHVDFN